MNGQATVGSSVKRNKAKNGLVNEYEMGGEDMGIAAEEEVGYVEELKE